MPKHPLRLVALFLISLFLSSGIATAQDEEERRRAFQLYKDGKYVEALPVFEKVAVAYPKDAEVMATLGFLVVTQTVYLKDAAQRKQARLRGREILLKAQELGSDSTLVRAMIESVPPDGGDDTTFSTRKEVDEAMHEGEAAFSKGDYPKALEAYQRALLFDPNLYEAALFVGDVYFATADQKKAGEWFARAVAINPDRETAYRYWGDALMKQGRATEAGEKFVEAYIAEPYNRLARSGLLNWGNKLHMALAHPPVDLPTSVARKEGGGATVTLDPKLLKGDDKDGSGGAWMIYGIIRASWATGEFLKQHPSEKSYRHSLKEEVAAIRGAIATLKQKGEAKKGDEALQILIKLDKESVLEPFILLALPDEGIVQDFAAYRKTNVENLRRYVKEYVLKNGGQ
jgi:tetratricopeptide (TPR) repeat protein